MKTRRAALNVGLLRRKSRLAELTMSVSQRCVSECTTCKRVRRDEAKARQPPPQRGGRLRERARTSVSGTSMRSELSTRTRCSWRR